MLDLSATNTEPTLKPWELSKGTYCSELTGTLLLSDFVNQTRAYSEDSFLKFAQQGKEN